jgi:hypothetical protein
MNIRYFILSERSQTQRITFYGIPLIWHCGKGKTVKTESTLVVESGLWHEGTFSMLKMFCQLMLVVVTLLYTFVRTWIDIKRVSFIVYKLCLRKLDFKKIEVKKEGEGALSLDLRAFPWCCTLFIYEFLFVYTHYTGGFIVTIPVRLILYMSYIVPMSLPLYPLPTPHKAVAPCFPHLYHMSTAGQSLRFFMSQNSGFCDFRTEGSVTYWQGRCTKGIRDIQEKKNKMINPEILLWK